MSSSTLRKIEKILKAAFHPSHLDVEDDSARHAGHAGAASGGGHYRVILVSARFEDLSLIERHRRVQEALKELLASEIHALQLKTLTPREWKERTPP